MKSIGILESKISTFFAHILEWIRTILARIPIKKLAENSSPQLDSSEIFDAFACASKWPPEIRKATYATNGKTKKVAYFTNMLLDWFDQRPRYGGGEKYCINLAGLLRGQGLAVDIFQIAPTEFDGEYNGFHVRAIAHGGFYSEFNIDAANDFYKISMDYDYVIYNMPELSAGKMRLDAITICHGIWFDHNNYGCVCSYRKQGWLSYLYRAFANPKRVVSVDTNSINVIRAFWPELATKMRYIPNFVDLKQFFPPAERANERLKILFPRRSQINRGSRILADIIANVPYEVDFYWIGEGDDVDTQLILDLVKIDKRLHYEKASFDEMPTWYQAADIVVIPTIACEGTSLSCIEALASGCATVATNVGGLPDIIQDGVNGRLVDPEPLSIAKAINELIFNPEKRFFFQKRGHASATAFSLDCWRERWLDIFYEEKWLSRPHQEDTPKALPDPRIVIVTRNAYHGGVESLIRLESESLNAPVIVAGGLNNPEKTCPFSYVYVKAYEQLISKLDDFDVVLYHWPVDWAVQAIKDSGLPSVEFVHRTDTADCDKNVPTFLATHSDYVNQFLSQSTATNCRLIPNVVDVERFKPIDDNGRKNVVGAITSYYKTKGLDIFLRAWGLIAHKYPDIKVCFYGAGSDLGEFKALASNMNLDVEFNGPLADPAPIYRDYKLYVTASRIEGLPIAVLEALSSGVPVIASDISGHKIINEMARQNNLPEPLLLFQSEDHNDLASKMDIFLQHPVYDSSRDTIKRLFSPQLHNEGLRQLLYEAMALPRRPKRNSHLIEECRNNGVIAAHAADDGFILLSKDPLHSGRHCGLHSSKKPNLVATHSNYISYRYTFPEGTDRISCQISCLPEKDANVYVQFDWCQVNGRVVASLGAGRCVSTSSHSMYSIYDKPSQDATISTVVIVIRPNPGDNLIVKDITIKAWRSYTGCEESVR